MIKGLNLSEAMLSIVILFFALDFWYLKHYDHERQSGKGWSWDYTLFTIAMSVVVVIQPWLLPRFGWTTTQVWGLFVQSIGFLLIFFSFVVHIWARRHLEHFYTERVEVQQDHRVINTGPYAWVRHPIISTFFGLAIGFFVINPSLPTLAVMLYTFWDFSQAARQEEELLAKTLMDYRDYMVKTPRFFPRLRKP